MNKNEITEACEILLSANGIPVTKLPEVIDLHFNSKKELLKSLGLTEENSWRIEVPLTTTSDNRPLAYEFLREVCYYSSKYKFHDLSFLMDDKNKVRVGKIIPVFIKDYYAELLKLRAEYNEVVAKNKTNPNDVFRWSEDIFRRTHHIACEARLNDYITLDSLNSQKKIEEMINKLSCFYGDYIKNGRVGYLSGNPIDYFTLSGVGCSYSSCIKMDGGEYFNSVLAYLANKATLIAYSTEKTLSNFPSSVPKDIHKYLHKKIGRLLMYVFGDIVISSRMYGNMYDLDAKVFRDVVQKTLGGEWVTRDEKGFSPSAKIHTIENHSIAYVDFAHGITTYRKDGKTTDYLRIEDGICLKCGDPINKYPQKGMCKPCAENRKKKCDWCGKNTTSLTLISYTSEYVCSDCIRTKTVMCQCCGRPIPTQYMVETLLGNGKKVKYCNTCISTHITTCKECKKPFFRGDMVKKGSTYTCSSCIEKNNIVVEEG